MIKPVIDILLADTDVTALVADRIFPMLRDQASGLPAIMVEHDGIATNEAKGSTSLMDVGTVLVHMFSTELDELDDLALKVRAALDGYQGPVGSYQVEMLRFSQHRDQVFESEVELYNFTHDYLLHIKRTGSAPSGSCADVTILDQDGNTVDTVAAGGEYEVVVLTEIVDLGTGNSSTIIDPLT